MYCTTIPLRPTIENVGNTQGGTMQTMREIFQGKEYGGTRFRRKCGTYTMLLPSSTKATYRHKSQNMERIDVLHQEILN